VPTVSVVGPGQSSFVGVVPPQASPLALAEHPVHVIFPVVEGRQLEQHQLPANTPGEMIGPIASRHWRVESTSAHLAKIPPPGPLSMENDAPLPVVGQGARSEHFSRSKHFARSVGVSLPMQSFTHAS